VLLNEDGLSVKNCAVYVSFDKEEANNPDFSFSVEGLKLLFILFIYYKFP
jgi:hypothetical protein